MVNALVPPSVASEVESADSRRPDQYRALSIASVSGASVGLEIDTRHLLGWY
jgi:hypothetical protein